MIEIKETLENNIYHIKVVGEVDASSSIHLDNALAKAIQKEFPIAVDLSELAYISSAGLGVFISYIDDLQKKNLKFVLYGLTEKVTNVFQILGLQDLFEISSNVEAAMKVLHEES